MTLIEVRPEHSLEASLMPNDDLVTAIQVCSMRIAQKLEREHPVTSEDFSWEQALEREALRRMAG